MHQYAKKKILDPGIIIKSLSTGKFCHAPVVFMLGHIVDYHEKCIKECFQKMDSLQCPECRQNAKDHPLIATVVTECEQTQS